MKRISISIILLTLTCIFAACDTSRADASVSKPDNGVKEISNVETKADVSKNNDEIVKESKKEEKKDDESIVREETLIDKYLDKASKSSKGSTEEDAFTHPLSSMEFAGVEEGDKESVEVIYSKLVEAWLSGNLIGNGDVEALYYYPDSNVETKCTLYDVNKDGIDEFLLIAKLYGGQQIAIFEPFNLINGSNNGICVYPNETCDYYLDSENMLINVSGIDFNTYYKITRYDSDGPVSFEFKEIGDVETGEITDHFVVINGEQTSISKEEYDKLKSEVIEYKTRRKFFNAKTITAGMDFSKDSIKDGDEPTRQGLTRQYGYTEEEETDSMNIYYNVDMMDEVSLEKDEYVVIENKDVFPADFRATEDYVRTIHYLSRCFKSGILKEYAPDIVIDADSVYLKWNEQGKEREELPEHFHFNLKFAFSVKNDESKHLYYFDQTEHLIHIDSERGAADWSAVASKRRKTLYNDLIQEVTAGIKNGFSDKSTEELDISVMFDVINDYEVMGYLIKDIDGDGDNELLFGANPVDPSLDSVIYDIYTVENMELKHILDGWDRNRYYMCEDGTISNEGSSGAAYSEWCYYKYADHKITLKECIFTDDENGTVKYYYSTDKPYSSKRESITKDKAEKIISEYKPVSLDFTPFIR